MDFLQKKSILFIFSFSSTKIRFWVSQNVFIFFNCCCCCCWFFFLCVKKFKLLIVLLFLMIAMEKEETSPITCKTIKPELFLLWLLVPSVSIILYYFGNYFISFLYRSILMVPKCFILYCHVLIVSYCKRN